MNATIDALSDQLGDNPNSPTPWHTPQPEYASRPWSRPTSAPSSMAAKGSNHASVASDAHPGKPFTPATAPTPSSSQAAADR
jgi:hypothetical protein